MKDMQTQLEKLRTQAAECELICALATDRRKRDLFTKLAEHYKVLAREIDAQPDTFTGGDGHKARRSEVPGKRCAPLSHCPSVQL